MKRNTILIVEDDPVIRGTTTDLLKQNGYGVTAAASCAEARSMLKEALPDLLLLDLNLPDGDGLGLCRELMAGPSTRKLRVFIITARGATEDIVLGLEAGAQEYMVKPFNLREFLARVQVLFRRHPVPGSTKKELVSGRLRLSLASHEAWCGGRKVNLTLREFELLRVLMGKVGRVFTKKEIISEGWEPALAIEVGVIDVHVSHLRSKLGSEGRRIETVRMVGLRLAPP